MLPADVTHGDDTDLVGQVDLGPFLDQDFDALAVIAGAGQHQGSLSRLQDVNES